MEKPVRVDEELRKLIGSVRMLFPHLSNISDDQIVKAIKTAKALGLDPIKKEVHFVPYKGSLNLIVSYTEYIKRAERSGKLNGWNIETGKDDIDVYAEVVIYRKDWDYPLKWRVYLNEVRKDTPSWKTMPVFMLRKVAIAQGFRLAFPEEVAELPYTEDEVSAESVEDKHASVISEAQAKRLRAIAKSLAREKEMPDEHLKDIVKGVLAEYEIENVDDIPRSVYDEIVDKIQERIKQG